MIYNLMAFDKVKEKPRSFSINEVAEMLQWANTAQAIELNWTDGRSFRSLMSLRAFRPITFGVALLHNGHFQTVVAKPLFGDELEDPTFDLVTFFLWPHQEILPLCSINEPSKFTYKWLPARSFILHCSSLHFIPHLTITQGLRVTYCVIMTIFIIETS